MIITKRTLPCVACRFPTLLQKTLNEQRQPKYYSFSAQALHETYLPYRLISS